MLQDRRHLYDTALLRSVSFSLIKTLMLKCKETRKRDKLGDKYPHRKTKICSDVAPCPSYAWPTSHLKLIVALISFANEIIYVWHPWRATLAFVVAVAMAQGIQEVLIF